MRMRNILLLLVLLIAGLSYGFKDHLFNAPSTPMKIDVEVKTVNKTFSPNIQFFKNDSHSLTRFIDGKNICYKTGGGSLSCVINKSSLLSVSYIDIEVFESEYLYKYYDKSFNVSCYKSKGGKMSCVQN